MLKIFATALLVIDPSLLILQHYHGRARAKGLIV